MSSLRDLRNRRQSIESSRKLTSAMKMVASAKFVSFQKKWLRAKEHQHFLSTALSRVALEIDPSDYPLIARPCSQGAPRTLLILIGADRGLCGGFNNQLARLFREKRMLLEKDAHEVWAIGCGNRAVNFLQKTGVPLLQKGAMGGRPAFAQAQQIADVAVAAFSEKKIQRCVLIYTHFINAMRQEVIAQLLLPFVEPFQLSHPSPHKDWPFLEPTGPVLCGSLARLTLESLVHQALLESCLSEQGARMTAMENATRNGEEALKKINLLYNRKRQSLITNELLEVIAGANA